MFGIDQTGRLAQVTGAPDGIEQVGNTIDDKTGGKYSDKIDAGTDKAKEALDKLGGDGDTAK